ncbi:MAG: DUF3842 family protein [Lachnospiraceae bacterium]|jgi:dihydrodipicolinate reductase
MKLVVIDGQGGKMGRAVIEQLKKSFPDQELLAIGTNSIATSSMMKAGAVLGATGENPIVVACRDADIIIGSIAIVMADSLLGEITPAMANAISASKAYKILIPTNRCNHFIAGCQTVSLSESIRAVCEEVGRVLKES